MSDLTTLLDQKGISYTKTNNPYEILIPCTSGEHIDKTPSLSFNLQKNVFKCWSCNFSGGVNKFLHSIGIETPFNEARGDIMIRSNLLLQKINVIRDLTTPIVLPEHRENFFYPYRMLSVETMIEQQVFLTKEYGLDGYLCFPIYEFGKLRFIEGRLLNHVEGKPKWYRYPMNLDLSNTLYPLDKFENKGLAILVEGLLDCLYLRSLGYKNVLCIFGTSGFTFKKAELLKNYGVANVIPLMDGDIAGQRAMDRIEIICQRLKLNCQKISLELNKDPKDYTLIELKHIIGEPT